MSEMTAEEIYELMLQTARQWTCALHKSLPDALYVNVEVDREFGYTVILRTVAKDNNELFLTKNALSIREHTPPHLIEQSQNKIEDLTAVLNTILGTLLVVAVTTALGAEYVPMSAAQKEEVRLIDNAEVPTLHSKKQ